MSVSMSSGYFMQLHQARQVKWFDGKQTIGEMLDNNAMTLEMLAKGIESENSQIKIACSVLRVEREKEIQEYIKANNLPRNLDEARSVVWPYDRRTGKPGWTIGQLLDTHEISQGDLNYAVKQRWNEQVYRACVIILSNMLNIENTKIINGPGPVPISMSRQSFMSEEGETAIYKRGFWIGLVFAFWIVLAIGDAAYLYYHIAYKNLIGGLLDANWLSWLVIVIGVTLGGTLVIKILNSTIFRHIDNIEAEIKSNRLGQIGEDKVADALREYLDGSCHIFRNYHINGQKHDIDEILLSPWGIFAIEVKNYSGTFELNGTTFLRKIGKKFTPQKDKKNPIKQVRRNAAELKQFLDPVFSANNCKPWVEPVLIWANSDITSFDSECAIRVWRIENLIREINKLKQSPCMLTEQCYKDIEKKLMKFYE